MASGFSGNFSNLPPGCSVRDIPGYDADENCEVCGRLCWKDCVCPECPACGACGDPKCYVEHGLKPLTKEQTEEGG